MIITYQYVQNSINRYENNLKFYQRWWYRWFGEPRPIANLRKIVQHNSKKEDVLGSQHLIDLSLIFFNTPKIKEYFPKIEDFQATAGFLDLIHLFNKAKCLSVENLDFMVNYNHHAILAQLNHSALFSIVLKWSKAEPCLLNTHNLNQLKTYQAILDYAETPLLFDDKLTQHKLDAIFALCQIYSTNVEKARAYINEYIGIKPVNNPYHHDFIFSRGVTPVRQSEKLSKINNQNVSGLNVQTEEEPRNQPVACI